MNHYNKIFFNYTDCHSTNSYKKIFQDVKVIYVKHQEHDNDLYNFSGI